MPVSVIIPTFNRAHFVPTCIESVLSQTVPVRQIIVVDDGSADGTPDVLRRFGRRIEVLRQENRGKSAALNAAMAHVRGDFVWVMDDDDIALPDAVDRHLQGFARTPRIGFTYGTFRKFWICADGSRGEAPAECMPAVTSASIFPLLLEDCFITGFPAVMVRTDCYREVGRFDEALIMSEDYDMLLRLGRRYAASYVGGPLFLQRQHEGARGTAQQRIDSSARALSWKEHDRQILRRLHQTLPLDAYLPDPPAPWCERVRAEVRREGLIRRMAVMGRKEEWALFLEDLKLLVDELNRPGCPPLTVVERAAIRGTMKGRYGLDELLAHPDIARRMAALCRGRGGRRMRLELAKPLLTKIVRAARAARFADAWRLQVIVLHLLAPMLPALIEGTMPVG